MKKITYDYLIEGKIETARLIFRSLGAGYKKCANKFTEEELIKTFDFFNKYAGKGDDEAVDIGMWEDFLEASESFLSKKSYTFLRSC